MTDRFGGLDDRQERDLVTELWNYLSQADNREINREKEAERRHKELLARVDGIVGAVAAGMRTFADALDRRR